MIRIDMERCKGCKLCMQNCSKGCIGISSEVNKKGYFYAVYKDGCISCRMCAVMCPDSCIEVLSEDKVNEGMTRKDKGEGRDEIGRT